MEIIVDFAIQKNQISNLENYNCVEILEINNMENISHSISLIKLKILDLQEFLENLNF